MIRARYTTLFLILILLISFGTGCPGDEKPLEKKPRASEQKPKAPPALKSILNNIDMMNEELDKKAKMEQEKTRQGETEGQTQASGKEAKQKEGKSQEDKEGKTAQTNQFIKEEMSLKNIHRDWNSLEPEAVKAGLSVENRNNFETTLDALTRSINEQKLNESRLSAIAMYKNYAEISRVFATPTPPEFYLVKYEAATAGVMSENGDFTGAKEHISSLKDHWNMLKVQAKDTAPKLIERTEFSINDLEHAIEIGQVDLVVIKRDILMNNLKKLEGKISGMQ